MLFNRSLPLVVRFRRTRELRFNTATAHVFPATPYGAGRSALDPLAPRYVVAACARPTGTCSHDWHCAVAAEAQSLRRPATERRVEYRAWPPSKTNFSQYILASSDQNRSKPLFVMDHRFGYCVRSFNVSSPDPGGISRFVGLIAVLRSGGSAHEKLKPPEGRD